MAAQNSKGVYVEAHNDNRGTSHINFYDRDPKSGPHESIHINIRDDGKGTIVESDGSGNKTTAHIDLNK